MVVRSEAVQNSRAYIRLLIGHFQTVVVLACMKIVSKAGRDGKSRLLQISTMVL